MLDKLKGMMLGTEPIIVTHDTTFTGNNVPGREIKRSFGLVSIIQKKISSQSLKESEKVIIALHDIAVSKGGNAVINLRLEMGSYQEKGDLIPTCFIVAYGEAVKVE